MFEVSSVGYSGGVTDERWLTPDEQRAWRALAGVAMRLPTALEAQLQRDNGIGHFAYWVLAMLSEADERTLAMSDLARMANSSPSRLSHAVARLERSGWVTRRPHPDNGRVTLASLTDRGTALVRRAAPGHAAEVVRLVVGDLDPDQLRVLTQACEQVLARLDGECAGRDDGPEDLPDDEHGTMSGCSTPTITTSSSSGPVTTA
jgi:DNA-binding MarR family transcriptional regulator